MLAVHAAQKVVVGILVAWADARSTGKVLAEKGGIKRFLCMTSGVLYKKIVCHGQTLLLTYIPVKKRSNPSLCAQVVFTQEYALQTGNQTAVSDNA